MPVFMIGFIGIAAILRFAALAVSIRNEKRLKQAGAVEYGATTSTILALVHIAYYLAAIAEGLWRAAPVSAVTVVGLVIYTLSMIALAWVLMTLGRFWTVKIIIARDHELVTNRFFRMIRHPNYYLNMIPELIGFALALQAYGTLIVGLPVYLVILRQRIRQEDEAMRGRFTAY
ncbi:isoprenylcysteine carboxylmethyltransferase family protein [uncultured Roseibium sp.]|uniref:isoprenylcysteine carboxyl methyltransferase family protein n=1 Tax=uncultured Roseibium sp. TaxID=1936171 RepID=UPI0032169A68